MMKSMSSFPQVPFAGPPFYHICLYTIHYCIISGINIFTKCMLCAGGRQLSWVQQCIVNCWTQLETKLRASHFGSSWALGCMPSTNYFFVIGRMIFFFPNTQHTCYYIFILTMLPPCFLQGAGRSVPHCTSGSLR